MKPTDDYGSELISIGPELISTGPEPGRHLHGVEPHIKGLHPNVAEMIRPLLWPLVDKWNSVVTDRDMVRAAADDWRQLSKSIQAVNDELADGLGDVAGHWEGEANLAFERTTTGLLKRIAGMAPRALEASELLREAKRALRETEDLVEGEIHKLIGWASTKLGILQDGLGTVVYMESAESWTAALPELQASARHADENIERHLSALAEELRPMRRRLDALAKWLDKEESGLVLVSTEPGEGGWETGGLEPMPPQPPLPPAVPSAPPPPPPMP